MPDTEISGISHDEIREGIRNFLFGTIIVISIFSILVTVAIRQQRELVRTQTREAQAKASATLKAQQLVCQQPKYANTQACLDVATRVNVAEFNDAVQEVANDK